MPHRHRRIGYLYVLLAAALWALLGPVSRLVFREGVTPLETAFLRSALAWPLFAVHAALLSRRAPWRGAALILGRDLGWIAAFAVVGVAGLYASLPLAVEAGGAALAVVLLYTAPAWVALLSWALLGERMTARKVAAVTMTTIGIVGIAVAERSGMRPSPAAIGWGLLSGISYASFYLFGRRFFARWSPATVFAHALPIAALVLLPLVTFAPKSGVAWAGIAAITLLSTYGAYLAYGAGLARLEPTRAATVATAEPLIAALLAFVFWNERFAPAGYAAAGLVILGVVLTASAPEADGEAGSR